MENLIKLVRQDPYKNSELLFDIQEEYAKNIQAPLFCFRQTSSYRGNTPEPIGKYLIGKLGVEAAIKKMSTELITGCPKTGRTWCD